jgi:hypothetical protein
MNAILWIQFIIYLLMFLIPLVILILFQIYLVKKSYLKGLILPIFTGVVTSYIIMAIIRVIFLGADVLGSLLAIFFVCIPTGILTWLFKHHQNRMKTVDEFKKTIIQDLN